MKLSKRTAFRKVFCFAFSTAFLATASLWADMPQEVFYQAYLTTPEGEPLASDNVNLQLDFFDQETRGTLLHQVIMQGVDLSESNGYLSVYVPTRSGKSILDGEELSGDLYLQVTLTDVGGGTPSETLEPRQRFAPVPTALNADMIDGLDATEFVTVEGTETIKGAKTHLSPLAIRIRDRQPEGREQSGLIVESSLAEPASTFVSENSTALLAISGTNEIPEPGSVPNASIVASSPDGIAIHADGDVQVTGDLTLQGVLNLENASVEKEGDLTTKDYVDNQIKQVGSKVDGVTTQIEDIQKKINNSNEKNKTDLTAQITRIDSQKDLIQTNVNKLELIESSNSKIETSLNETVSKIEPLTASVDEIVTSKIPELEKKITDDWTKKYDEIKTELSTSSSNLESSVQKTIEEKIAAIAEENSLEIIDTKKLVDESSKKLSEFEKSISASGENLDNVKNELAARIDVFAKELQDLRKTSSSSNDVLTSKTEEAKQLVESFDQRIEGALILLEEYKELPAKIDSSNEEIEKNKNLVQDAQGQLSQLREEISKLADTKPAANAASPNPVVVKDDALTSKVQQLELSLAKIKEGLGQSSDDNFAKKDGNEKLSGEKMLTGSLEVLANATEQKGGSVVTAGSFSVLSQADSKSNKVGLLASSNYKSEGSNIGSLSQANASTSSNIGSASVVNANEKQVANLNSMSDASGVGLLAYNPSALGTAIRAEAPHPSGIALKANGRVEIDGDLVINGKQIGTSHSESVIIVIPDNSSGDGVKLSEALERVDDSEKKLSVQLMPGSYEFDDVISITNNRVLISGIAPEITSITFGEDAQIIAESSSYLGIENVTITGSALLSMEDSESRIALKNVITSEDKPLLVSASGFTTASSRPMFSVIDSSINGGIRFSSDPDQKTVLQFQVIESEVYTIIESEDGLSIQLDLRGGKFWNSGRPITLPDPEDGSVIRNTTADLSYYKGAAEASSPSNLMEEFIVYWRK